MLPLHTRLNAGCGTSNTHIAAKHTPQVHPRRSRNHLAAMSPDCAQNPRAAADLPAAQRALPAERQQHRSGANDTVNPHIRKARVQRDCSLLDAVREVGGVDAARAHELIDLGAVYLGDEIKVCGLPPEALAIGSSCAELPMNAAAMLVPPSPLHDLGHAAMDTTCLCLSTCPQQCTLRRDSCSIALWDDLAISSMQPTKYKHILPAHGCEPTDFVLSSCTGPGHSQMAPPHGHMAQPPAHTPTTPSSYPAAAASHWATAARAP